MTALNVTMLAVALALVGLLAIAIQADALNRQECAGLGGIYVANHRGSDICYVDGLMVRAY
jgi:uncharacterized membrane protein